MWSIRLVLRAVMTLQPITAVGSTAAASTACSNTCSHSSVFLAGPLWYGVSSMILGSVTCTVLFIRVCKLVLVEVYAVDHLQYPWRFLSSGRRMASPGRYLILQRSAHLVRSMTTCAWNRQNHPGSTLGATYPWPPASLALQANSRSQL